MCRSLNWIGSLIDNLRWLNKKHLRRERIERCQMAGVEGVIAGAHFEKQQSI